MYSAKNTPAPRLGRLVTILVVLLTMTGLPALHAGSLDPAHVPADAQWLIHVDYESMADSTMWQKLCEENPVVSKIAQGWMTRHYGIDPPKDLKSLTMFSRDYREYTGTVIVQADYGAEKIETRLNNAMNHRKTQWRDHTLHTITLSKQKQSDDGPSGDEEMTVVMVDPSTILLASSVSNAKESLKLLAGESPSLKGKDSALLPNKVDSAWMYGAAINLGELENHSVAMPIIAQHQQIRWSFGEQQDGTLYERADLVARSEDVAKKMKTVLDGIVAYERLWADGSEPMMSLMRNVTVTRNGTTTGFHWQGPSDQVVAAMEDLFNRMETWKPILMNLKASSVKRRTALSRETAWSILDIWTEFPMNNRSFNRRRFAQLGTASMVAATAASGNVAKGQSDYPDDSRIQPVGGQSINTKGKDVPLAPPDDQPPNLELPDIPKKKYGWAIVGLGQLALSQIMPAFGLCELSQPKALVSGHADKAKTVAEAYGVAKDAIYNYDNFDKIASDDRINVVYIVLPNSMHAEFTIRALEAGKHVLCEKPMAVSIDECQRMIAAAEKAKRKLMIAYRLHYEPMNRKVMQLCDEKRFGQIKAFSSSFCINVNAPNIRLAAKLGGGPVGDVGVYPINAARYVTGEEPVEAFAQAYQPEDDPRFREVPESVSCLLRFPSGVLANLNCSFSTHRSDFYRVACTDGMIELSPAFSYNGQRLMTHSPSQSDSHSVVTHHEIAEVNHFASEMDHLSRMISEGREPRTPGEEGLADMRILAAMAQSIRDGKPAQVGQP